MDVVLDWVALSLSQGLGVRGYWYLLEKFKTPTEVLRHSPADLERLTGLRKNQLSGLASADDLRRQASEELVRLDSLGSQVLTFNSPDYPQLLKEIADPPPLLYVQGNISLLNSRSLAIVGSRASTSYGSRVASHLARELSRAGLSIVSGLALGIDTEAHQGALAVGGDTIAVLGCGLNVIYPWQNKKLYDSIREHGVLVTEYPLATRPDSFRFPARNRIIAGMSSGVLVVEAASKSGSLITAQLALDFGREVFAVPGQVDSMKSAGAHWLLQQGAKLVQTVDDVLSELPPLVCKSTFDATEDASSREIQLTEDEQKLLNYLDVYPVSREELLLKCEVSVEKLSEMLLALELEDLVEMLPGGMLRRV